MNEENLLTSYQLSNLHYKYKGAYFLWFDGYDMRLMFSRSTFYRYRKFFLDFDIDIGIKRDVEPPSNVRPLIRVLEAVPASIPDFAFEQGLVHHSARKLS